MKERASTEPQNRESLFEGVESAHEVCTNCGNRIGTEDEWEGMPGHRLDERCWNDPGTCPGVGAAATMPEGWFRPDGSPWATVGEQVEGLRAAGSLK